MIELAESLHLHLASLGVTQVEVLHTERDASFRGSDVSAEGSIITASARERHLADGYGFWDHVVASAVSADNLTRVGLFRGAVRTKLSPESAERMSLAVFARMLGEGVWEQLPGRQLASLSSHVATADGSGAHLFMLDLGLPEHLTLAAVRDAMRALEIDGQIVRSGRSYHLYAHRLGTWSEYVAFLARASLLSPLVDSRWALRQITDGRGSLRISSNSGRDVLTPTPAS